MNETETVLLETSNGVFLDMASCGSSVRWGVEVVRCDGCYKKGESPYHHLNISAQIAMTDCSRSISWDCDSVETGIKKVSLAIKALGEFRRELLKARKLRKQHKLNFPESIRED